MSHPLRVRGLKPDTAKEILEYFYVASFTGAWVETLLIEFRYVWQQSHPLRVRGLKH